MAVNPYHVAVVGYGLSAKVFHIPFINAVPDLKVYGVVQRSPTPDDDAAKDHPGIKTWRSFEEMLPDPSIDLVVLTTTPQTHFDMCKACLSAGKNVIVEKPFVPTSKEADELITLAHEKKKFLTIYQNRRWDSDFLTLQNLLQTHALGDVVEFETHFDRHRPAPPAAATWKTLDEPGNETIYDLGTHLLDQVYVLFGMPKRVTAFLGKQRRIADTGAVPDGPTDSFTVLLHYDRLLVTAKAGVVSPHTRQLRYWVRGTKGSFHKFHLDPQEEQLRRGLGLDAEGFAVEPESHHGVLTVVGTEGEMERVVHPTVSPPPTYTEFYRVVAEALVEEGEGKVPVPAEEARDVLRIIEAAKKSSVEWRSVEL